MTTQVPDTCMVDGRSWAVESWDGNYSSIPTNEELGIETKLHSTANYSGRIDHFIVHKDKLYLLKIEVNFVESGSAALPSNANREVLFRYEKMLTIDEAGERMTVREYRFEFLVFHDLFIPYTGDLFLSYPNNDPWELPIFEDDEDNQRKELCLVFRRGVLIDSQKVETIDGNNY